MTATTNMHVYAIPDSLLQTVTLRDAVGQAALSPTITPHIPAAAAVMTGKSERICSTCESAPFADLDAQRLHYKSDLHRYNVKRRLAGHPVVSEIEFSKLVDALDDSISGSESTESDDESSDDAYDGLVRGLEKTTVRSESPSRPAGLPQTALVWFHSPPSTQIGIYKAILPREATTSSYLTDLARLQTSVEGGRKWALFMTAGGHFAGAIVRVSKDDTQALDETQKKHKKPKPDVEILYHKTFHRYTTRRKQGGSQSVNDNAKGNAKSAGAQLRRYGEQALRDDIRNLLDSWSEEIHDCERIWIRANTANRKIFLGQEADAIIKKGDPRLRTFPFPTRRPTQSEISRCILELTRVKISHLTEEALRAQDEEYLQTLAKQRPAPVIAPAPAPPKLKPKTPQLSKEDIALRDKWTRLLEMVNKGRLDALKTFWSREGSQIAKVDEYVPESTNESGTLLQLASEAGHEPIVAWLLDDLDADPTVAIPHSEGTHRTAYDLARTRGVRNAFRRSAASRPDRWDWLGQGRIPSLLSEEMEKAQEDKRKQRKKGLKEKMQERESNRQREQSVSPPPPPEIVIPAPSSGISSRKLGGSSSAADGLAGLSPEMRMKIERERRARAAEARFSSVQIP